MACFVSGDSKGIKDICDVVIPQPVVVISSHLQKTKYKILILKIIVNK